MKVVASLLFGLCLLLAGAGLWWPWPVPEQYALSEVHPEWVQTTSAAAVPHVAAVNESAAPAAPPPSPPADPTPAPAPVAEPATTTVLQCLQSDVLSINELTEVQGHLDFLTRAQMQMQVLDKTNKFWVYIPPLSSAEAVNQRMRALKQLGIRDFYPIFETGDWQYSISLGIFSSDLAAQKHLAEVKLKGVQDAVAGPRNPAHAEARLILSGLSAEQAQRVQSLAPKLGWASSACASTHD